MLSLAPQSPSLKLNRVVNRLARYRIIKSDKQRLDGMKDEHPANPGMSPDGMRVDACDRDNSQ
jgi:hypothetical protein